MTVERLQDRHSESSASGGAGAVRGIWHRRSKANSDLDVNGRDQGPCLAKCGCTRMVQGRAITVRASNPGPIPFERHFQWTPSKAVKWLARNQEPPPGRWCVDRDR